jgi:hypothetical protein
MQIQWAREVLNVSGGNLAVLSRLFLCIVAGCQSGGAPTPTGPSVDESRDIEKGADKGKRPPAPPNTHKMTVYEHGAGKPPPNPARGGAIAKLLWSTMDIEKYRAKTTDAAKRYAGSFRGRDSSRPLVVALGSSSSGGFSGTQDPNARFWPSVVQDGHPHLDVVSLAVGGATTWHMGGLLDELDIQPAVCILYIGHNDGQRSSPRQSLASLERGEVPQDDGFVAWVSLDEARQNIEKMKLRCSHVLAMQEYSVGNERQMEEYAKMLSRISGITYADGAAQLESQSIQVMHDEIHPNNQGQHILGLFVSEKIQSWSAGLK